MESMSRIGFYSQEQNYVSGQRLTPNTRAAADLEYVSCQVRKSLPAWYRTSYPAINCGSFAVSSFSSSFANDPALKYRFDVPTVEVNRPNRQHRCRFGKQDTADAEAAARAVGTGQDRYRRAQERRRSRGGGAHPATSTTFCPQGAHLSRQPCLLDTWLTHYRSSH
jgi:hypothetical protein